MVHNVISPRPRNNFSELLVRIGSDADKKAFSEIFEHFAPRLKNYLMKQGSTDNQAEELVQQAKTRFHVGIVRPPAIYGPEDTRLLPLFRAAYKRWAPIPGGLHKTLSLIHVKDCAAAIVRTLEADYPSGTAFFVDDGAPHSVTELVELMGLAYQHRVVTLGVPGWLFKPLALAGYGLSKTLGREPIITPSKIKELLCPHWVCESTQTQAILNWQPQIPLARGIAQTCEWYQQEGWL